MSTRRRVAILFALAGLAEAGAVYALSCDTLRVAEVDYAVCRVDVHKDKLRLAYADAAGTRYESFESLRGALARDGKTLAFAMNAGMFHPDFRPVGLLVIDGKTLEPINRAAGTGNFYLQPNGVFMVDAGGARVLATEEFRQQKPPHATQS